jgi:heat shock protein HslJ
MRMRAPLLPLSVLGLLAVVTACGDDSPVADSPPTVDSTATTAPTATSAAPATSAPTTSQPAPELDGRQFVATEVTGYELVPDSQIRLSFEGDSIGATGGCNSLASTWSLDGDQLVVAQMAMTEMACEPTALMDQDTWLASFLSSGPAVALDGDTLTLTGTDASITLLDREVAEPDRELEGTAWALDSVVSADAVSSFALERVPTLRFEAGELAVDTGCNTGGSSYEATADQLTIGPIRLTRMACTDPNGSEVEAAVLAVLEGQPSYTIDSDLLTLTSGEQGLVYRASDEG